MNPAIGALSLFAAASTNVGADALKPEAFEKVLGLKYEETLYDPQGDKYVTKEEYLKLAKDDPARIMVVFNPARKEWLPHWLRMPHMTVGSDSMWSGLGWDEPYAKYSGHPRTAGAHAKTLRLGREQGVPLMHTLSQLSYWSALHLGKAGIEAMNVRGRMQENMVADITVFDPKTVTDNATYKAGEHGLPSTGIPYVIVNGRIIVTDSKAQKVFAGQPIRYPVEENGRHVPASTKQQLSTFSIDDGALKPRAKQEEEFKVNPEIEKQAAACDRCHVDQITSAGFAQ